MSPLDVISAVLIVLAAIDVIATITLVRAAVRTRENSLTERAMVSVLLTAFAVSVALLAVNRLGQWHLPTEVATVILVGGLLLISVPQIVWLVAYRRQGFR